MIASPTNAEALSRVFSEERAGPAAAPGSGASRMEAFDIRWTCWFRSFVAQRDADLTSAPEGPEVTARRQFLRTFLHDLATPLSAVSLHLEGANRRLRRGDDPAESLDIARAELSRAFELFEQGRELLLSRPSTRETFLFDDWVESAARDLATEAVRIEGRTDGKVAGDRAKLAEALSALLVNALESESPLSILRERRDGRLQVRIENRGLLPSDDPEKL